MYFFKKVKTWNTGQEGILDNLQYEEEEEVLHVSEME